MEHKNPYAMLDQAIDDLAEATFGAGENKNDTLDWLRQYAVDRFIRKYQSCEVFMQEAIANNARLMREREEQP